VLTERSLEEKSLQMVQERL